MNDSSKYESSARKEFVDLTNERKNALGAVEAFGIFAGRYAEDKSVIACGPQEVEYFNRIKQSMYRTAGTQRPGRDAWAYQPCEAGARTLTGYDFSIALKKR